MSRYTRENMAIEYDELQMKYLNERSKVSALLEELGNYKQKVKDIFKKCENIMDDLFVKDSHH